MARFGSQFQSSFVQHPIISMLAGAVVLLAALVSIWNVVRGPARPDLVYELEDFQSLADFDRPEDIRVFVDSVEVRGLHLVSVRLSNVGREPLRPEDVVRPIRFTFGRQAVLHRASVGSQVPKDLGARGRRDSAGVTIEPLLLNPGDSFVVTGMVEFYGGYGVSARIPETELRERTTDPIMQPDLWIALLVMLAPVGLPFVLVTLLSRSDPNSLWSSVQAVTFLSAWVTTLIVVRILLDGQQREMPFAQFMLLSGGMTVFTLFAGLIGLLVLAGIFWAVMKLARVVRTPSRSRTPPAEAMQRLSPSQAWPTTEQAEEIATPGTSLPPAHAPESSSSLPEVEPGRSTPSTSRDDTPAEPGA